MTTKAGEESAQEVARAASGRLVATVYGIVDPILSAARAKALARAYRVLEAGGSLDGQTALGVVLELWAIESLERKLRKLERTGLPGAADPPPPAPVERS